MQKFKGNPPILNNGWATVGHVEADGVEWQVFRSKQVGDWINLKVCAAVRVPRKANYWTAYSIKDKRMAGTRDVLLMRENRPALHEAVFNLCRDLLSPADASILADTKRR